MNQNESAKALLKRAIAEGWVIHIDSLSLSPNYENRELFIKPNVKRIAALEAQNAALREGLRDYEHDNGKIRCRFCKADAFTGEEIRHRKGCKAAALLAAKEG